MPTSTSGLLTHTDRQTDTDDHGDAADVYQ